MVQVFHVHRFNRLKHGVTAGGDIILHGRRLFALGLFLLVDILVRLLGDNIHISDELLVLTNRQIQRSDLCSVELCQGIHDIDGRRVLNIHSADVEDPGKMILLAQIPRLLCSDFHAALSVDHDDGGVGSRGRFLGLADKIKISWSIENIDLHIAADHRRDRGADRELSVLLLFIIITERIPVGDIPEPARNPAQIGHRLQKARLTRAAVAQKHDIADLVSVVNFHPYHPPFT